MTTSKLAETQKTLPAITTFVRNFASEKSLKDVLIEIFHKSKKL